MNARGGVMIYTYKECIEKYKTDYEIRKLLATGDLKRVARGVYSDESYESDLAIVSKRYPYAVFTMHSAFYYHSLTDTIPRAYYLMTDKNSTKIKDKRVCQFFDNYDSLTIGVEKRNYNGTEIRIFNRERMLVELIRNKKKLSFDYYKEIIANYRNLVYELDVQAVQEYAMQLPKTKLVLEALQLEVF